jgi:3-hydroxyisobutyrate dehydrogenase-like beta-hydroxyacid dehydrogenase
MATDLALALPVSAAVKERYDLAERLGHGNQDFAAVHEILAKTLAAARAAA